MRIGVHFDFAISIDGRPLLTRPSWGRLTKIVKRNAGAVCYYCGQHSPKGHVDHLTPLTRGGTDDLSNLVWACAPCNLSKQNQTSEKYCEVREATQTQDIRDSKPSGPTADQVREVLELHAAGESKRSIERAVFGFEGGAAYRQVSEIIEKKKLTDQVLEMHNAGHSDTAIAGKLWHPTTYYIQRVRSIIAPHKQAENEESDVDECN